MTIITLDCREVTLSKICIGGCMLVKKSNLGECTAGKVEVWYEFCTFLPQMAAAYAFDWPLLPGTEPRPVTPIQWPSSSRIQPHATLETNVQFPIQLPVQSPVQLLTELRPTMPTMSLPPEAQYKTLDALYEAAQLHTLHHGYAFVKRRSKKVNASGRTK
jgi:hypothetical protein